MDTAQAHRTEPARSALFVDDHPIYLDGLSRAMAAEIDGLRIATAMGVERALDMLERDDTIDLCVTDQRLPDGTGADLVARVRRRFPSVAIGVLTAEITPDLVRTVRANGGVACLSKERDIAAIAEAVRTVFEGGEVFDAGPPALANLLSERRLEIVRMAAEGHADKQICVALGVTESTIRNHWQHIFERLGAANRTEAVTKALRLRLI